MFNDSAIHGANVAPSMNLAAIPANFNILGGATFNGNSQLRANIYSPVAMNDSACSRLTSAYSENGIVTVVFTTIRNVAGSKDDVLQYVPACNGNAPKGEDLGPAVAITSCGCG